MKLVYFIPGDFFSTKNFFDCLMRDCWSIYSARIRCRDINSFSIADDLMNYVEHDFSTFFRYELSSGSLTYTLKNCVIDTFVKEEDPSTSDFVCIFNAIKDNKSSIPLFLYGNKFNGRSRSDMFFIKND